MAMINHKYGNKVLEHFPLSSPLPCTPCERETESESSAAQQRVQASLHRCLHSAARREVDYLIACLIFICANEF